MNWDIVQGNWMQLKGRVKERWGKLTDDEIDQIDGQLDQLSGKIQERYGKSRDAVRREIESFCDNCSTVC